jgi:hypothetical protein
MRKELKSSDLCLPLKSAAITIDLANILSSDIRSILSIVAKSKALNHEKCNTFRKKSMQQPVKDMSV